MAYTEADRRAKLIDPTLKTSNWLKFYSTLEYYFYTNIHLAIIEAFGSVADIFEGYLGLQREVYR